MKYYYNKYLKYKQKYLELKDDKNFAFKTKRKNNKINQKGGNYFINYNNINRFSTIEYPEMEELLNPIYGCFLKKSDFIKNNYFLYNAEIDPGELLLNNKFELEENENPYYIINNNLRKKIFKLSNNIEETPYVDPSNDILYNINPKDIGRFMAILYFMKTHDQLITYNNGKINCWFNNGQETEKIEVEKLQSYINNIYKIDKIKNNIKLGTKDKMDFYLLLYCLWYILKNDDEVNRYYEGIQDVFNITNKYSPNIYNICPATIPISKKNITFEEIVIKTISSDFTVYRQEKSRSFCHVSENNNKYTYPDCGETTMRNLINLLCFDVNIGNFNPETLEKYKPIFQLLEYYKIFNNFSDQTSNIKKKIYDQMLNARDAWSYLIIHFAHYNLNFNEHCSSNSNHGYNIKASAKTSDGKKINSLQLLNNLLKNVVVWDDLNNDNLTINSNLDDYGRGTITIEHNLLGNTKITYACSHAWCNDFESHYDFNISHLDLEKQIMINILTNQIEISQSNYLFKKYGENIILYLDNEDQDQQTNFTFYEKLLELSLTDIISDEVRKQIYIDMAKEEIGKILKKYNRIDKINEYIYYCNDFNFVREYIPNLKYLKCQLHKSNITSIDLSPLENIISIGSYFLSGCSSLETIDLYPLCNITSISSHFLSGCSSLETIDLSPLSNITSIGANFLSECSSLNTIDLSPLSNITSIGKEFLKKCQKLTSINLSPLANITSISSDFLEGCSRLTIIDLSPLSNISEIGHGFLQHCTSLTSINLSQLCNITTIYSDFLSECSSLKTIDLSPLSNVTLIGESFLYNCNSLNEIDLLPLSNITSISTNFLSKCSNLKIIDLSPFRNVVTIERAVLSNCTSLVTINLSQMIKLNSIGLRFLYNCTKLETINLLNLVNLTQIGSNFLSCCTNLKTINLSPMTKLNLIRDNFLFNCTSLKTVYIIREQDNIIRNVPYLEDKIIIIDKNE